MYIIHKQKEYNTQNWAIITQNLKPCHLQQVQNFRQHPYNKLIYIKKTAVYAFHIKYPNDNILAKADKK